MTLRVLLVEDDAAIRRFVELALDGLSIHLEHAATLAQARERMARFVPQLVLTDLMLPDGDGMSLLETLHQGDVRDRSARMVVFSARVSSDTRRRALALGAWRVLDKPVPLATLIDTVRRAQADLLEASVQGTVPTGTPCQDPPAADSRAFTRADSHAVRIPGAEAQGADAPEGPCGTVGRRVISLAARQAAIDSHFGGQDWLYDSFLQTCRQQFAADLRQGDAAVATGDRASVRRLAHSLKTVLNLLGGAPASSTARSLEAAAETDGVALQVLSALWASLRTTLVDLR